MSKNQLGYVINVNPDLFDDVREMMIFWRWFAS